MKHKLPKLIAMLFPLITFITAQPTFPGAPDQAPIGGLGLLAAAGGAMALKKLIDKHKK
ncbi:MAG: hypothetical protein QF847_07450 [Candidatus Marinimicrobia bacterium]|jgi:hypothetical protein|nr:hypothetical protein [Candidatus Neomarinimicrobiota bacterium]MDP6610854.1 hypothetical protein [Candidatus Neomarinimicrobiota bacterium]MDP6727068.1 hypothetical protein [Candidatus Neomarinimicrobiota bacterium]|tara:strand:+ start:387 stop:563 length:177 start_codon:yes stop_codon:yes gene_type:complete